MAGGKGKSSGGKSSGGKTSAEGPKKQQSHSARAGLQVSFGCVAWGGWCFLWWSICAHSILSHIAPILRRRPDFRRVCDTCTTKTLFDDDLGLAHRCWCRVWSFATPGWHDVNVSRWQLRSRAGCGTGQDARKRPFSGCFALIIYRFTLTCI